MAQKLTFAGSTIGEPWWTVGEIVAEVLKPHGYDVKIEDDSASHNNIPWVVDGRADIGVTTTRHFAAAKEKKGVHAGSDLSDLRGIASLFRPSWMAIAIRRELGINSLDELRQRKHPVGVLAGGTERGGELDVILGHYGMSMADIESWGGQHYRWSGRMEGPWVRQGLVDLMIGNIYTGYTPHGRYWYEATILQDMQFLDFGEDVLQKLVAEFGYGRGRVPHGIFPGVDRDIDSVTQPDMTIYSRKELDPELATLVARELDDRSDLFAEARSPLYYDRRKVGASDFLPFHPAVQAYYQSKGYPIRAPARAG
jgi:uncharacterized protein